MKRIDSHRSSSVFPRERAGERREKPSLTRARQGIPGSYYPEVPVLGLRIPYIISNTPLGGRIPT